MKITALCLMWAALASPSADASPLTPAQSVLGFYRHYLSYLRTLHGKTRAMETARKEDRSATEPYLTSRFARKLEAHLARCAASAEPIAGCDSDSFYCAQEEPTGFAVKRTSHTTDSAWVLLEMKFGARDRREVRVRVDRTGGKWLIDRVRCPKPGPTGHLSKT